VRTPEATSEQLIAAATAVFEDGKDNPLALTPLPVTEGGCGWLNTGLLPSAIKGAEEQEIVTAIIVQALAAFMLDGFKVVKA
jgi:hypothetical protein